MENAECSPSASRQHQCNEALEPSVSLRNMTQVVSPKSLAVWMLMVSKQFVIPSEETVELCVATHTANSAASSKM